MSIGRVGSFACLLLFVGLPSEASADPPLKYEFQVGKKSWYQRTLQGDNRSFVDGKQVTGLKVTETCDMVWNVKKVNEDGSAEIGQTITRIVREEIDTNEAKSGKTKFDSRVDKLPENDVLDKSRLNKEFVFTMSPTGEVSKVEAPPGNSEFVRSLEANPIRIELWALAITFPKTELKKGDQWESEPLMIKDVARTWKKSNTYEGRELKEGKELAKFTGKTSLVSNSPDLKVKSEDNSFVGWFDPSAGVVVESTSNEKRVLVDKFSESVQDFRQTMKMVPEPKN